MSQQANMPPSAPSRLASSRRAFLFFFASVIVVSAHAAEKSGAASSAEALAGSAADTSAGASAAAVAGAVATGAGTASSIPIATKNPLPKPLPQRSATERVPVAPAASHNKIFNKKTICGNLSGIHRFPPQEFSIGFKGRALSKKALKILKKAEQTHQKHCPASCRQENIYKTFIQIQPARSQPGSCPKEERKEIYAFKKTYSLNSNAADSRTADSRAAGSRAAEKSPERDASASDSISDATATAPAESDQKRKAKEKKPGVFIKKAPQEEIEKARNRNSIPDYSQKKSLKDAVATPANKQLIQNKEEAATRGGPQKRQKKTAPGSQKPDRKAKRSREALVSKMDDWILRTFVYAYIPGVGFTPTKEAAERKTDKACPKCSFYFDYNYFFEEDRILLLDIAVRCGDRKKGLSLARAARLQIQNHWRCRKLRNSEKHPQ